MQSRRWFLNALGLAVGCAVAAPLLKSQDRDDRGRRDDRDHHDHDHFDDRDRAAARDWYRNHHDAFRHDEGRYWRNEWEPNIREGFVLTPGMRGAVRPVPRDLYGRFAPPPPGYRYVEIGNHIVLVDRGYRIHDVLHFELKF